MLNVSISAVASALFAASAAGELSQPARRLGLDLLGSAAGFNGVVTESVDVLSGRVGVSWNRARVLLGDLAGAGFLVYWSYSVGGRRWCLVSFLAWSIGAPRAVPAALAGDCFGPVGAGDFDWAITENVLSDAGRSGEIADPVVVVVNSDQDSYIYKNNNNTRACVCEGAAPALEAAITENVLSDSRPGDADRVVALLTDPDVGMSPDLARRCAAYPGDFGRVFANVLEWRRQRDSGALRSPLAALKHRLSQNWDALIVDADRRSDLWFRHCEGVAASIPAACLAASSSVAALEGAITGNVLGDTAPAASSSAAAPAAVPAAASAAGGDWWADFLAVIKRDQPDLAIWLRGSSAREDGDRLLVSVAPDRLDWVRVKLSPWLRRRLAVDLGRPGLRVEVGAA